MKLIGTMGQNFFIILIVLFACLNPLMALPSLQDLQGEITINNRVLAKINGKPFSVIDLMKKMEVIFYREFPEYSGSIEAKYQFFNTNWRFVLDEMIDSELIVASAKEVKMNVSDGDVRQEIEKIFGPNVVVNIDKLGMSYEEVFKMLLNDLTVQRMTYGMAHIQAMSRVGPQEIRKAYETYAKEHPIEEAWEYRVISIKAPNPSTGSAVGDLCYNLLTQNGATLETLSHVLKEKDLLPSNVSVSITDKMERSLSKLSDAHKQVLQALAASSISKPVEQAMKGNLKQTVTRIFCVQNHIEGGTIPLKEIETQLKNYLIDRAINEETAAYRKKLRKRFGIDENYLKLMIPENFEPFNLISTMG